MMPCISRQDDLTLGMQAEGRPLKPPGAMIIQPSHDVKRPVQSVDIFEIRALLTA